MITWKRFCQFIGVTPDICGNIFCIYVDHLTTTCRIYDFLLPSKVRDWLSWFWNKHLQQTAAISSDFDTNTFLVKQVSRRVGWWKETTHIDWSTSGGKRQTRCRLDAISQTQIPEGIRPGDRCIRQLFQVDLATSPFDKRSNHIHHTLRHTCCSTSSKTLLVESQLLLARFEQ